MKPFRNFLTFIGCLVTGFLAITSSAWAIVDNNAAVVKLRYDDPAKSDDGCQEGGVVLHNCFTTGVNLRTWITQTRKPAVSGPLLVDIGPGTFTGFGNGLNPCNISFRGSGRQKTILDRGTSAYAFSGVVSCNTDFSNLTFRSIGGLGGINLNGGGQNVTTTWTDVEINSTAYGWTEGNCSTAKHYWFNSRITTRTGFGIARAYSSCSENWFFGSEITAIGTQGESASEVFAIGLDGAVPNETHVYGSVIRAIAEPGVILPTAVPGGKTVQGLVAVSVGAGSSLHIHGTGIDAVSAEGNHIAVLGAGGIGAELHVNASAYNLRTGGGGSITRILNPNNQGHVHAPYLWEHVPNTDGDGNTVDTNFNSIHGADQTTVTVSGGHPHPAIYSSACPANARWFDTVDKICVNK